MTDPTSVHPQPVLPLLWRIVLIVIAAIEVFSAAFAVPAIFEDYGTTDPLAVFAQRAGNVDLALAPLLTGAALILALVGRVRYAIAFLAVHMLVAWAMDLPGIAIHGLELTPDYGGAYAFCARFIYPLIAAGALLLAWRNQRLILATILVALPTVANWAGILVFALGVSIYGF